MYYQPALVFFRFTRYWSQLHPINVNFNPFANFVFNNSWQEISQVESKESLFFDPTSPFFEYILFSCLGSLGFCWSAVYCIKSSTANVNLRNVSVIYVYNNTTSMTLGGNFTFAFRYLTNSLTPAFFLHKFYNSGVFMLRTPGVRIFTVSPFGAKA